MSWVLAFAAALLCTNLVAAEDPPAAGAEAAAATEEQPDETKQLLDQLTITMISEVVDERTLAIRDTTSKGRKLLRLGNTAGPAQGSLSHDDHQEKTEASKAAMSKLVAKQMVWWKAAPEENQPKGDAETVVGDIWLFDGSHLNSLLKKEGHLMHVEEYKEELARNILTAEADEKKKESYKELEEALKENESKLKSGTKTDKESALQQAQTDLKTTQEQLDKALEYYEKLKPTCVDSGITYEERVKRREEEIVSLQEALKILEIGRAHV